MKPSVGRIVHYVSHGTPIREDGTQAFPSVCRAAMVTEVTEYPGDEFAVGLCVMNPTGLFFHRGVEQGGTQEAGCWHWPERVDDEEFDGS